MESRATKSRSCTRVSRRPVLLAIISIASNNVCLKITLGYLRPVETHLRAVSVPRIADRNRKLSCEQSHESRVRRDFERFDSGAIVKIVRIYMCIYIYICICLCIYLYIHTCRRTNCGLKFSMSAMAVYSALVFVSEEEEVRGLRCDDEKYA